jgi:ribosomal-protein-alanine N-acetyltransferase
MRWWDIPAVSVLEHAAFPEDAWSVGMFWSELAESASRYYLVAEDQDADGGRESAEPRIVGYAGLLAGLDEAEVLTIAVDPAREGRGLGRVLLTELLREAARRGCDDVVLEVRVDNDRAQRLYGRFGFTGIGVRKGYYQPMNVDALVMRASGVVAGYGGGHAAGSRGEYELGEDGGVTGRSEYQSGDGGDATVRGEYGPGEGGSVAGRTEYEPGDGDNNAAAGSGNGHAVSHHAAPAPTSAPFERAPGRYYGSPAPSAPGSRSDQNTNTEGTSDNRVEQ